MPKMSEICVNLDHLEVTVTLHLNNAQASLASQQVKFARSGLMSAAIVQALAGMVKDADVPQNEQIRRFTNYFDTATRLIGGYWEDFGLVILKRAGTEQQLVAEAEIKPPKPKTKHIKGKDRRGGNQKRVPPEVTEAIQYKLLEPMPAEFPSRNVWYKQIAADNGVSSWYVYQQAQKIGAVASSNGNGNH
jgi:hypothetical protein